MTGPKTRRKQPVEPPKPAATIELFQPRTTSKSWGNETLVAENTRFGTGYTGKILHRLAGPQYHRAGLQIHTAKDETFYLYQGLAWVYFVAYLPHPVGPRLCKFLMQPGMSVHVPAGAIHSVQTQGPSVMFEAAEYAPESETVNVEEDWDIFTAVEIPAEKV